MLKKVKIVENLEILIKFWDYFVKYEFYLGQNFDGTVRELVNFLKKMFNKMCLINWSLDKLNSQKPHPKTNLTKQKNCACIVSIIFFSIIFYIYESGKANFGKVRSPTTRVT